MSTARIFPPGRPVSIPPPGVQVVMSAAEVTDLVLDAMVDGLRGKWQEHRPPARSEESWKAVQARRQPLKLGDLAHLFEMRTPEAIKTKASVLAILDAARGHDRRIILRRTNMHGRRSVDGGVR